MQARLAQLLIVAAAVLGAVSLPRVEGEVRDARAAQRVPTVEGVRVLGGMPLGTDDVILRVRELPPDEPIRVVTPAGPCRRVPIGQGQGAVYWLQYQVLPRAISCAESARWSIYLNVPSPAGERRVVSWPRITLTRR